MARRKNEFLTEVEFEFMEALWQAGKGTVREIHSILSIKKPRAYTSVATILKVLDDKGYVTSTKEDRTLVYSPALSRSNYEKKFLRQMSNSMFGGTPSALVARLIEDEELSEETIVEIRRVIDERMGRDASG